MKTLRFWFICAIVLGICMTNIYATYNDNFIIGTERAETKDYYDDFVGSLEEVVALSNRLLANHPREDGSLREITSDDVDFTKMFKCYHPTAEQLQLVLETELTDIPETWDFMWTLPITIDGYTVHTYYSLCQGIEPGHLLTAEDGTPLLSEEELATLDAQKGHFVIASGTVAPTEAFASEVLSVNTVDAASVEQFCYLTLPTLSSRAAWVHTEEGNTFYLTNCDDSAASEASVFSLGIHADGMSQDDFRQMFNEAYAAKQAEMAVYDGEDVYGASNVSDAVAVSDMVLPALLFAVMVTGVFIAVLYFRRRRVA